MMHHVKYLTVCYVRYVKLNMLHCDRVVLCYAELGYGMLCYICYVMLRILTHGFACAKSRRFKTMRFARRPSGCQDARREMRRGDAFGACGVNVTLCTCTSLPHSAPNARACRAFLNYVCAVQLVRSTRVAMGGLCGRAWPPAEHGSG